MLVLMLVGLVTPGFASVSIMFRSADQGGGAGNGALWGWGCFLGRGRTRRGSRGPSALLRFEGVVIWHIIYKKKKS